MIPKRINMNNDSLPDTSGVYFYYDKKGKLLYIGKATSLKKRVGSYFTPLRQGFGGQAKAHDRRIADLVSKIARIEYTETPTVIEALVLEANEIKKHKPYFNILQRDDKSFLYLVITKEDFPKPLLVRGLDLKKMDKKKFIAIYGPYTSSRSLKIALDLIRKSIPWSRCERSRRACFYRQLNLCPGVCTGEITPVAYRKIIRRLMWFFEGKKGSVIRDLKREMQKAAMRLAFEKAAVLKRQLFALEHIADVALISKEEIGNVLSRIEAYDISNISGTSAVGSMVVFENGKPAKSKYRKFKIKTVKGSNDVAMMEEVVRRRLRNAWPLPQLMVIDGGLPQVNRIVRVLKELGIEVPIVGLAKGFDRKQDRLVFAVHNLELKKIAEASKETLQRARDEAHRFAISYHRELRRKAFIHRHNPIPGIGLS